MSLRKSWDVADIANQLHSLSRECSSSYNDGITSFEFKKELYIIKEVLDQALSNAPDFGELEKRWLNEREQKRIITILKS